MTISSRQLEAFSAVMKVGNFSEAAKKIHITQSALSQRISSLERDLGTSLLIREQSGIKTTPAGQKLLRYCQTVAGLEEELIGSLTSDSQQLNGTIRIAGFSSIVRSVVLPALDELMRSHPNLEIECFSREVEELEPMLKSSEVDFIVTSKKSKKHNIASVELGIEKNILVESTKNMEAALSSTYLDHDENDQTTIAFHQLNNMPLGGLKRRYLDEIYAIIEGAERGWGRAVVPEHLIGDSKGLVKVKGKKSLDTPVILSYFESPYSSKLHQSMVEKLVKYAPQILSN